MDSQTALKLLEAARQKYSNYGAMDTEGRYAVMDIEESVLDGKPFPLRPKTTGISARFPDRFPFNPFSLYDTIPGWEVASAELVTAAEVYWKALIQQKLGIAISADSKTLDALKLARAYIVGGPSPERDVVLEAVDEAIAEAEA